MGITVTFSSYEEMVAFAMKIAGETAATVKQEVKKEAPVQETPDMEGTPVQQEPINEDEPVQDDAPTYTLEEIRAELTALSRAGKREFVKTILEAVGANNVTSIDTSRYAEVMQKAKEA